MHEIEKESSKSISSLQRLFKQFLNNLPIPKVKSNKNCHLLIDGTYYADFCILNYLDNDQKYLQFYGIVKHESYDNYLNDLKLLKKTDLNIISITSNGQRGLKKAISEVFLKTIHQRCVIHIQRMSLIFLKEKSETLSNRTWYTHKTLRRIRALIKNALPNMFHYLDNSEIPKSTSGLECRFSYLKNNLNIHRGLSRENRINFVKWYNFSFLLIHTQQKLIHC